MANKKQKSDSPDFAFEAALEKLTSVVGKMEGGDLSLEQALQQFEEGVSLAKQCHQALQQAEQRVEILMNNTPPTAENEQ